MNTLSFVIVLGVLCLSGGIAHAQEKTFEPMELSLENGLVLKDASTGAKLRIGARASARVEGRIDQDQEPGAGFVLDHMRLFLKASLLNGRVGLFVQQELVSGKERLLDVEASVRLGACSCAPRLVLGYYRPWTTRSFRTGLPVFALPTRGVIAKAFHGSRDLGMTLTQDVSNGLFEYYVGVFEGKNISQAQRHPRRATIRVAYNPMGAVPYSQIPWFSGVSETRVSLALNGAWENPATLGSSEESLIPGVIERHDATLGGDITMLGARYALMGEGFFRTHSNNDESSCGAYLQGSGLIVEQLLDASVRAGLLRDVQGSGDTVLHLDASTTLYMKGPSASLMLYYNGRRDLSQDQGQQDALGVQGQLFF